MVNGLVDTGALSFIKSPPLTPLFSDHTNATFGIDPYLLCIHPYVYARLAGVQVVIDAEGTPRFHSYGAEIFQMM